MQTWSSPNHAGSATIRGRNVSASSGVSAGIGVGNTIQTTAGGGTIVQVFNDAWTTGTASVQLSGTPLGDASAASATAMGLRSATPGGAGRLVAVAPVGVSTTNAGNLPSFAVLDLTYVPEPGTLLLLGSGVAALGALGGRRLRR